MVLNKRYIFSLFVCFFLLNISTGYAAKKKVYKPFVLAQELTVSMDDAKKQIKEKITNSPFRIVADYTPYEDAFIYIITSDALLKLASKAEYGGFAAVQRVALTKVNNIIQVAYTNPIYMQHAFLMAKLDFQPVFDEMNKAFGYQNEYGGGLNERKLKRYRYSFGLESFKDFYELPEYNSHAKAVAELRKGFKDPENGISEVFSLKIPGTEQTLFGVSMDPVGSKNPDLDMRKTMDVIDHLPTKRTPFLPYEILVDGDQILALHARFRIAVYFSDLKMFGKHGFGKLFSTPNAYGDAFTKASGGKLQSDAPTGFIQ